MSNRRLMLRRQKKPGRLHDQRAPTTCSSIPMDLLEGTDFDVSAIRERIAEEQKRLGVQGEAQEDPRARGER